MPYYNYQCKECGNHFEKFGKISERHIPVESPCPSCNTVGKVEQIVTAPLMHSGEGIVNGAKMDNGFKEVLQKIKQHHPLAKF